MQLAHPLILPGMHLLPGDFYISCFFCRTEMQFQGQMLLSGEKHIPAILPEVQGSIWTERCLSGHWCKFNLLILFTASQLIPQYGQYSVTISPSLGKSMSKFLFIEELGKSNLPHNLALTTEHRQVQLSLSETGVATAPFSSCSPEHIQVCSHKSQPAATMGTLAGTFCPLNWLSHYLVLSPIAAWTLSSQSSQIFIKI